MFLGFNKKKESANSHAGHIFATQNGKAVSITEVPDPVFSEKILGDGVALIPNSSEVLSPVDGKIINVADTYHAYGIQTPDGLEILIHVGINTVELKGRGFDNHVKVGDTVQVGTPLCDVDWNVVKEAGYESWTPILITNMDIVKNVTIVTGDCEAGKTCVINYEK